MNNIPQSLLVRHFKPSSKYQALQLDELLDQERGSGIQHADDNRQSEYKADNNERVIDEILLGRPRDLLELRHHVLERAGDTARKSDGKVLRAGEEAGLLHFLVFRHLFHILVGFDAELAGFLVSRMLLAETAVLAHFDTVRIVALILHRVVIALLALRAGQRDLHANTSSSHVQDTSFSEMQAE